MQHTLTVTNQLVKDEEQRSYGPIDAKCPLVIKDLKSQELKTMGINPADRSQEEVDRLLMGSVHPNMQAMARKLMNERFRLKAVEQANKAAAYHAMHAFLTSSGLSAPLPFTLTLQSHKFSRKTGVLKATYVMSPLPSPDASGEISEAASEPSGEFVPAEAAA